MEPSGTKNTLSRYIGPALILTLFTSTFYIFGMVYLGAYFGRFSFQYQILDLSPTLYIIPIIITLVINIVLFLILYELNQFESDHLLVDKLMQHSKLYKNKDDKSVIEDKLFLNILGSFLIYGILWSIIYSFIQFFSYLITIPLSIMFIFELILLYIVLKKFYLREITIADIKMFLFKSFGINIRLSTPRQKQLLISIFLFCLIFFNLLFLFTLADNYATNLVEGKLENYEVMLNLNESNCYLPNETFILVMQHEGCLFLVQKKVPAPRHSTLYVVPITKINYCVINLNDSNNQSKHDSNLFDSINLTNLTKSFLNISLLQEYNKYGHAS